MVGTPSKSAAHGGAGVASEPPRATNEILLAVEVRTTLHRVVYQVFCTCGHISQINIAKEKMIHQITFCVLVCVSLIIEHSAKCWC